MDVLEQFLYSIAYKFPKGYPDMKDPKDVELLNELLNEGAVAIPDFEDETIATFGLKYFAAEYGTKSQYLFAIKNFEGIFIAILGVDYTKEKHKLKAKEIEDLTRTSISLGGVLSNHLKS